MAGGPETGARPRVAEIQGHQGNRTETSRLVLLGDDRAPQVILLSVVGMVAMREMALSGRARRFRTLYDRPHSSPLMNARKVPIRATSGSFSPSRLTGSARKPRAIWYRSVPVPPDGRNCAWLMSSRLVSKQRAHLPASWQAAELAPYRSAGAESARFEIFARIVCRSALERSR